MNHGQARGLPYVVQRAVMTDISMAQRSRSGRGVFADTGDQLLNFSFKYGDPVAIPRPYDSGGYGVGYRPRSRFRWSRSGPASTIQGLWGGPSP